jgi:uncharacterized membrane protein YraQ (UPF0718 family)
MSGLLAMGAIAAVLAIIAARRGVLRESLSMSVERFVEVLPRVALALFAAGFIGHLIPSEPVGHLIGANSGFLGIAIAALVGGFIPSGPMVSFPVVVIFVQAGAGFPQVVAFVTAWSVIGFHRVLIYEIPLMGWRFSAVRLTASIVLPLLAGLFAQALQAVFALTWPPH